MDGPDPSAETLTGTGFGGFISGGFAMDLPHLVGEICDFSGWKRMENVSLTEFNQQKFSFNEIT